MEVVLPIVFFVGIPLILWVACSVLTNRSSTHYNQSLGETCGFLGGVTTIVSIVLMIFWISASINTRATVNDMVALYETNKYNYEYAIENTEDVNIVQAEPGILDVAYIEQGKITAQRIVEYRNAANLYNTHLRKYRDYNTHLFLKYFYHDPPEYLRPIVILEESASP